MSATTSPAPVASRTPVGALVMVILGAVLTMIGSSLLVGLAATSIAAVRQSEDGFLTTPTRLFSTDGYAVTTPRVTGFGDRPIDLPFDIGDIRLRVNGDEPVFVGIAAQSDVDRYLDGVRHSEVTEVEYNPFRADYREVPGSAEPADPTRQDFWVASASGSGEQELNWNVQPGAWTVVVMNEDASAGVSAEVSAGFRSAIITGLAVGFLVAGLLTLLAGIPLTLAGATGVGRVLPVAADGARPPGEHPVRLVGHLDAPLSRGLWLVKWLLAIPHYIVLTVLWVAFLVSTIAAGVMVLFTGRYPRTLFAFNVGVLRWNWRVGFYTYSALGTDRYPPFSFARTDYPADLEIAYPERLNRGLVLVKWWLLAIPHYLVLAALTGGLVAWWGFRPVFWPSFPSYFTSAPGTISVLAILVIVAGVILLFTGRYDRGLFDLVVGINRWVYRVAAYTSLMRDEYPPFRLDQGPDEHAEGGTPAGRPVDSLSL